MMSDNLNVRESCWRREIWKKESLLISRDGRQERVAKRVRAGRCHRNEILRLALSGPYLIDILSRSPPIPPFAILSLLSLLSSLSLSPFLC